MFITMNRFRRAHSGAGSSKGLTLGHPEFEGFDALDDLRVATVDDAA